MLHLNPMDKHLELMANAPYRMSYRPGMDVSKWQEEAREKLKELLGLPLETAPSDDFTIISDTEDGPENGDLRYHDIYFTFSSEPTVTVACHLLLPLQYEGRIPLMICLQGHTKGMHISLGKTRYPGEEPLILNGDRDFGPQIVRKGFAALVMEQRGFGDRGGSADGPGCYQIALSAMLIGRTLIGERCWDVSRGIDCVLAHFDMIDSERIGLMGQSGGGTVTCYETAIEPRIKAAIPSCAFCGYMDSIGVQRHCTCNYVPGIMKYFDMSDLAGMAAPRPLIIVNGAQDTSFPLASNSFEFEKAQKIYEAAGAADNIYHVVGPEGHRYYAALAWPEFDKRTGWDKTES